MAEGDGTRPAERSEGGRVRAYYELTKPGIAGYVMVTAGVSAYVGGGGTISLPLAVHTMLSTGMATAGALSINQLVEREEDAIMERTRSRPLPTGRLTPAQALGLGFALLTGGLVYMASALGALPALLTAASAIMYHGVYTPLKRHSYIATLAGAVPGALPMLIGWTAARGSIDAAGLSMFAIGYLWQLPHVLGLAWMLRDDYALVGFRLIPDGGARTIGLQMGLATVLLIPVSLLPVWMDVLGTSYMVGAGILGVAFAAVAIQSARRLTDQGARRVFLASLLYHPLLMVLMLLDISIL